MAALGINHVVVLGRVGKYGVALQQQGTPCARFLLAVAECGKDGKTYVTRVPIEIWGTHAREASTLVAGQLVLITGKLRKRKTPADEWELCVSGFEAVPVLPAASGGDPRQPSLF
jgi:single-stranded DNA-binding protein